MKEGEGIKQKKTYIKDYIYIYVCVCVCVCVCITYTDNSVEIAGEK